MPSRIHWTSKNNRSQHNLVGSTTGTDDAGSVPASAASASAAAAANPPSGASGPSAGGVGAANPPSASPNPAFSSSESFQPDTSAGRGNHAQPPPPPPHLVNIYGTAAAAGSNPATIPPTLQHSNSVSAAFDSRQRDQQLDFADQVARSQSHRYTQPSPTSTQQQLLLQQQLQQQQQQFQQQHQLQQLQQHPHHQQLPPGSSSVEDLAAAGHQPISSPILGAVAPPPIYSQQQPPPAQPPKAKQSTRRLIKNILNPRGQDFSPPAQNSSQFGGVPGLARRNSKRVSLPPPYPPTIRTGISQVSLDQQQQLDWQNQGPPTQPSPLQGVGDFHESYVIEDSDQALHLQHTQDIQPPTIRPVPASDAETSLYSAEDTGYRQHRGHVQSHSQIPADLQHQQYAQQVFEAGPHQQQQQQQQQYQFPNQHQHQHQQAQYQGGNQQLFPGHLGNPQQQNPETVSQLSQESPVADSDQRSATNIPAQTLQTSSPGVSYPPQTQDLPGRQNPPAAAQAPAPQQQTMAPPPPGGPPPARRSQEAEKMRDQAQPPPGPPPPSYRQSQQPNMNPLPQPPNAGPPNPNFRASNVPPERQQFEGQGDIQGRNSPQPPSSDRGEDPEKAFKDLCTTGYAPTHIAQIVHIFG